MNSTFKSYRDQFRLNWGRDNGNPITQREINAGALLRIADATELMAKSYALLIEERDRYKQRAEEQRAIKERSFRRLAAFRGYVTRLKRELANRKSAGK